MLLSSFAQAILKWLRVPPGASVRHADDPHTSSNVDILNDEYVQAILDITVDDICVGDAPLSIDSRDASNTQRLKLEEIRDEFNFIIRDVARDLLSLGYSVVDTVVRKNKFICLPYIDPVDLFLTKDKKVVIYDPTSKKQLTSKLIFINYNKQSLVKIENKERYSSSLAFKINPTPMQLKNADKTLAGIANAENSIARYRALLRPLRIANVDIGTAQGDIQKQVVDSIASSINANSESLGNEAPFLEFDDNIPVLPNRKGLGKVEVTSDIPAANLKDLADLDYWISKLNLIMRFPATYMDFSKNLGETAMSLVRSDLRYLKLCRSVQTKIVTTLNEYIQESQFNVCKPVFSLITYPSSEDDDVLQSLGNYTEIVSGIEDFIMGSEDSVKARLHRLRILKGLFSMSVNSPTLQRWFDDYESYLSEDDSENSEDSSESLDYSEDFDESGSSGDFGESGPSEDFDESGSSGDFEPIESNEDIEILEEQS